MQPGRDAVDRGVRERLRERLDERVAPRAVAHPHAAQVAVELAALEEVGERELVHARGPAVGEHLLAADGLQQPRRDH